MGSSNFGNSGNSDSRYSSTGSTGSGMGSSSTGGSSTGGSSTGGSGSYGETLDTGTSSVNNTDRGSMSGGTSGSVSGSSSYGGSTGNTSGGLGDTEVPMERAKETMQKGMDAAQDALGQLQSKASELTSRLIDNIDVDDLTRRLEEQVREHPTRTLLVAVGAGFLLGRAAKR